MLNQTVYFLMSHEKTSFHICSLLKNESQETNFESFPTSLLLLLGFKAPSASPIFEMLNGYNDRSHQEFLLFVYSELF